jgi:hypothetical protein
MRKTNYWNTGSNKFKTASPSTMSHTSLNSWMVKCFDLRQPGSNPEFGIVFRIILDHAKSIILE